MSFFYAAFMVYKIKHYNYKKRLDKIAKRDLFRETSPIVML